MFKLPVSTPWGQGLPVQGGEGWEWMNDDSCVKTIQDMLFIITVWFKQLFSAVDLNYFPWVPQKTYYGTWFFKNAKYIWDLVGFLRHWMKTISRSLAYGLSWWISGWRICLILELPPIHGWASQETLPLDIPLPTSRMQESQVQSSDREDPWRRAW